jgi:hypothetical protein
MALRVFAVKAICRLIRAIFKQSNITVSISLFLISFTITPLCFSAWIDPGEAVLVKFGSSDKKSAYAIERLNRLSAIRSSGDYIKLSDTLNNDLLFYKNNKFATQRILNEISDVYALQLFDLERSIEIDKTLLSQELLPSDPVGDFVPKSKISDNNILSNEEYMLRYSGKSSDALIKSAKTRLEKNVALLDGKANGSQRSYTFDFLNSHLATVRSDLESTAENTSAKYMLLSRLIRTDYELISVNRNYSPVEYTRIQSGKFQLNNIDFNEINFLQLADYLLAAYKKSGEIKYAEMALETVYRPYVNLRDPNARWRYNKLINDYISTLIEANYRAGRFDEMLYYVSLNKSRMLLEERLAYAKGNEGLAAKVSDLTANDGVPRTSSGLPTKTWFKQRLSSTGPYIDFYVGGKYVAQSGGGQKLAKVERSTIPLTTRDFGVEDVTLLADTFIDDALYVTQINGGKVVSVKKVSGSQLGSLKSQLDSTYQQIANGTHQGNEQASFFKGLMAESGLPAKIVISPDKWLARHPMDFHLGAKVTRSVNFFTASSEGRLNDLRVSGFFNPTLDLSGAEQEAEAIRTYIPDAQVFKREAAQLSALQSASNASVVHLSMHGQFNANDPKSSRLAFAGATRGSGVTSDPNSLYARDMYKYAALKDRDLIFAAACQTGLSAADQANENELMGILRPLTANRNKNIILSLWKVDDVATKDFVAAFYQRLAATRDVVTAFHYAQDEIRNKYQKPYYWAAFYLSKSD